MTSTPTANIAGLADYFGKGDTWIVLLIVVIFGVLGGWAHRLGAPKDDETPPLAYVVLGAVSALAALFAIVPTEPLKLVGLSAIAGYAGKAVLSALQARVEAAVSKAEAVKAKDTARKAIDTGRKAIEKAEEVTQKAGQERHVIAMHLTAKPERPAAEVVRDLTKSSHLIGLSPFFTPGIKPEKAEEIVRTSVDPDLAELRELKGHLEGLMKSLSE